jgi:hypothetical protein
MLCINSLTLGFLLAMVCMMSISGFFPRPPPASNSFVVWESTTEAGLEDDDWWGVCRQNTNLPVSTPATHCHFLQSSAAALVVCNRIFYEIAEMGVRSWRLVGGSQQKAAAYLTIGCRPLWLLAVIHQATIIAIAVHHHHSPLSTAICQGTMIGGETYLCCCPPPPLVADDFGGKTYLRCYSPPIVDHFVAVPHLLLLPAFDRCQSVLSIG